MEENDVNTEGQQGDEGPAKGGPRLVRAGTEAKGGGAAERSASGENGKDGGSGSAPAAAGTVRRAGRRALEGAQASAREAVEGAEALGQQAVEGAEQMGERTLDVVQTAGSALDEAEATGADVLREWVNCAQRAVIRNTRAAGELLYCRTPYRLLLWQSNLVNETVRPEGDEHADPAAGLAAGLAGYHSRA